ncbi:MAG: hypothetical protein Q9192_001091 [Flavoplaca navasiana]
MRKNRGKIPIACLQDENSQETLPIAWTNTSVTRTSIETNGDQDPTYFSEDSILALLMQETWLHLRTPQVALLEDPQAATEPQHCDHPQTPVTLALKDQRTAHHATSTLDQDQIAVLMTCKAPASPLAGMQVIDNIKEVFQALNTTAVAANLGPIHGYLAQVVLLPQERENVHLGPYSQDKEDHKDMTWSIPRKRSHTLIDRTYTPMNISAESLQGMGPALACDEWGMNETVGERLIEVKRQQDEYDERIEELAQKVGEGEFCRFRSKQERVDTMKTVQRNLAGQGDNAELDEEQEKEKTALIDARMVEERAKLATRLLKGDYYVGPLGKGPTAELLERYTQKNETYMPQDSQALAGKIRTLLPLDKTSAQGATV